MQCSCRVFGRTFILDQEATMEFNWNMPKTLRPFYLQEVKAYQRSLERGDLLQAWSHLERAHILGQPYPKAHTAVHFKMLQFGVKTRNAREVIGQIPRLLVGGVKSWAGTIPLGNTGGANVPPLQPMPIPDDLQAIINEANKNF